MSPYRFRSCCTRNIKFVAYLLICLYNILSSFKPLKLKRKKWLTRRNSKRNVPRLTKYRWSKSWRPHGCKSYRWHSGELQFSSLTWYIFRCRALVIAVILPYIAPVIESFFTRDAIANWYSVSYKASHEKSHNCEQWTIFITRWLYYDRS